MIDLSTDKLKQAIRNIPDFPKEGIQFKDITTLIKEPEMFLYVIDALSTLYASKGITKVAGIEARGFILGGALAARLNAGFVPIRKPGKLPAETQKIEYQLEYGMDGVEIHSDAFDENDVVLLHDDLLATGGTANASVELINSMNVKNIFLCFLCELDFLQGRKRLTNYDVYSLIHF
jgi:adenine phosphoribosyltransferase